MFRRSALCVLVAVVMGSMAQADEAPRVRGQSPYYQYDYQSQPGTWLDSILGPPAQSNPRPLQRTIGLPTGRTYYGNRYFGNFNNRYFGPQYGYF